jgi:hypothetical protein
MRRLELLRRLGTVYQLIEESHLIESRRAAAELETVGRALWCEGNILESARIGERDAMQNEDQLGRVAMAAQGEVTSRRKHQLEPLYEEKQVRFEEARLRLRESRLWNERVTTLIEREEEMITKLEGKRSQAASDDRFLALSRRKRR